MTFETSLATPVGAVKAIIRASERSESFHGGSWSAFQHQILHFRVFSQNSEYFVARHGFRVL
jgi:hypothetical protein